MHFEEIYAQYFKQVYSFILSLSRNTFTAEEITQETFFRVMENPDAFQGNSSINTYLCSIARNLYVSSVRKHKYESQDTELESKSDGTDIEDALIKRDMEQKIHLLLHHMEEPYKEVFTLRVFGDLSYEDIGALFEKNVNWARVTYFRARQKLQQMLKEE